SFGFGLALGFLPLSFALMGTLRRLFLPRFLELRQDTLSISTGFFQARVAKRDFITSRVAPKEKNVPPIEAGKYCFRCSYEGIGEIYDSNGGILWHFKTLHKRPHYPYGLFRLPDFVVYDK